MNQSGTPEHLLDKNDPGDDTQRRFRYQATYAALQSLAMLEENSEIACIFCEHWEDVLVKRTDNRFIGIQIKTRAIGKEPFKANDEEILNSIRRFVHLEKQFSSDFERYVIVANCGFWIERKNSSNLNYLLETLCKISLEEFTFNKHLSSLRKKLTKLSQENESLIFQTLQKVALETSPGFRDIENTLRGKLTEFPQVRDECTHPQSYKITQDIIALMINAASLPQLSPREEYLMILKDPEKERTNITIQDKKITRDRILELININKAISLDTQSTILLQSYRQLSLSELPRSMRTMELKMSAGNISIANIQLAKDHKFSTEYLLAQWLQKYGATEANARYGQLYQAVQTECQTVYNELYTESTPFGTNMLILLRQHLRDRHNRDRYLFYECTYEHLYGIAGILTEECLVWWSPEFEIEREDKQ